jgi:hypothetical protein
MNILTDKGKRNLVLSIRLYDPRCLYHFVENVEQAVLDKLCEGDAREEIQGLLDAAVGGGCLESLVRNCPYPYDNDKCGLCYTNQIMSILNARVEQARQEERSHIREYLSLRVDISRFPKKMLRWLDEVEKRGSHE